MVNPLNRPPSPQEFVSIAPVDFSSSREHHGEQEQEEKKEKKKSLAYLLKAVQKQQLSGSKSVIHAEPKAGGSNRLFEIKFAKTKSES